MTDEMILVPRAELLAWAKAWQSAYDPNDGTDCVTPFDLYLMKAPASAQPCGCGEATCVEPWEPGCGLGKSERHAEAQPAPYNRKRIAWELERTAMGDGYYGASLRAAKDFPEATPSVRSLLDRWSTGKERGLSDRIDLCAFAVKIYATDGESPQPPEAPVRCFTEEVGKDGNPTGYLLFGQSAPAGVPVGVVREYLDARACYEAATRPPNSHAPAPVLRHGDPVVLRLREARNDLDAALYLAQQPAASAPEGAGVGDEDCLTTCARELLADEYRKRGIGTGLVNDAGTATSVAIAAIATALAHFTAAAGELTELVGLLDEVRSHFTRDDDLPDDLLPRIDAALHRNSHQQESQIEQ